MQAEPFVKMFDLRTNRALPPYAVYGGARLLRFHPRLSSTIVAVTLIIIIIVIIMIMIIICYCYYHCYDY
jgi:hypothetical protein